MAASDPQVFVVGLVQVLATYPDWVRRQAVDPVNGLAGQHDFLPSLAIVRKFCQDLVNADERRRNIRDRYTPKPLTIEDRRPRPTYDELKEKHGDNWGLSPADKEPRKERWFTLNELVEKFGAKTVDGIPDAPLRKEDGY